MFWKRKRRNDQQQEDREEAIQDEIRSRILRESQKRDGKQTSDEVTQATLDALEEIVSLSREEMEAIAEQVRAEFREKTDPEQKKTGSSAIIMWAALILIIVTFFWARRGSSWLFFCGLILLFVLLNSIRTLIRKDDD